MLDTQRKCFRCSGRKSVFKKGNGYTLVDTGGIKVDCPLCDGKGVIPKLKTVLNDDETLTVNPVDTDGNPTIEKLDDVAELAEEAPKPKKRMGRPPKQQSIFIDAEERN